MLIATERHRFPVLDPSDGSVIDSLEAAGPDDGIAAVDAAARAAEDWAGRAPRERGEILRRGFELLTEKCEEIAQLIVREMGKPLAEARGEATYAAEFLRWFSEEAVRVGGDYGVAPAGTNRMLVGHAPIGVSLLITPWNFPAAMATRKLGPALAAGCTVVLKPAEETPLTALEIVDLLREAGVPNGVVNLVVTDQPAPLAEAVLSDPRVRELSFTGSTAVGRRLLELCAPQVISASLELGGNAYGLVAFVFSRDLRRALAVGEAIETGMVGLNRGIVSDPAAPFGGAKQSGLGREGGEHGLYEFLEPKYFAFD